MQVVMKEQVQQTAQILLAFLESGGVSVPGNMLEGIVSGKSLLRGLVSGQLVVAQPGPAEEAEAPEEAAPKPAAKKKASKAA